MEVPLRGLAHVATEKHLWGGRGLSATIPATQVLRLPLNVDGGEAPGGPLLPAVRGLAG